MQILALGNECLRVSRRAGQMEIHIAPKCDLGTNREGCHRKNLVGLYQRKRQHLHAPSNLLFRWNNRYA